VSGFINYLTVTKYILLIAVSSLAWTDTESQSGSERLKGSVISVKEAENSIDNTEFGGTPEPPTTSDVNSTHETYISESTRNGLSQDGDAESEATSESQKKTKIKRNTISPVDEEISENGRGTPDSLPSRGMVANSLRRGKSSTHYLNKILL
jgi:hypothetical protein